MGSAAEAKTRLNAITASRDKTVVIKDKWIDAQSGKREKVTLRSNRMVLQFHGVDVEGNNILNKVVVRGKQLSSVMRMIMCILAVYKKTNRVTGDPVYAAWERAWQKSLTEYEREFVEDNWVCVYIDGELRFGTDNIEEYDKIENLSRGTPITDDTISRAIIELSASGQEIHIQNETQIAAVINTTPKYIKCALLDRQIRSDGTFHFTLWYNEDKVPFITALGTTLQTACNIIEASSLVSLFHRTKIQHDQATEKERPGLKKVLILAETRVSELQTKINLLRSRTAFKFSPEAPIFKLTG